MHICVYVALHRDILSIEIASRCQRSVSPCMHDRASFSISLDKSPLLISSPVFQIRPCYSPIDSTDKYLSLVIITIVLFFFVIWYDNMISVKHLQVSCSSSRARIDHSVHKSAVVYVCTRAFYIFEYILTGYSPIRCELIRSFYVAFDLHK